MLDSIVKASWLKVVTVSIFATVAGCNGANQAGQGAGNKGPDADDVGMIGLQLQVPPGVTLNSVSYSITGPQSYSGTINLTSATTISTVLSVAAGGPYTLTLTGTATDGTTTCLGTSAPFTVTAHMTTVVAVHVTCNGAHNIGSILVQGQINVCPFVTSVSANPPIGNTVAIFSSASDPDAGPSPISYHWTTSAGTLSDANAANPTFTCAAPGIASLTLTVSDGDAQCGDTFALLVPCLNDAEMRSPAWVELGAGGQALARLITPYSTCPSITVDGSTSPMHLRVGPSSPPLRPTNSDPTVNPMSPTSKASVFPMTTCEFSIPAGVHSAQTSGIKLPLPKATVNRVVILGDTGCRVSIGNPWQNCGDWTQWPFPVIAQTAAAMQPDLVLHVGDYHYRDNQCPDDTLGCGGPWGYGYDVWAADLFTPAAPLLAAAPWVMVRGNHETCNRAGQGWYRFLDQNPYTATRSCDDAANDNVANYNDSWAVPFGDTQFIAFDSANASKSAYSPGTKPADVLPFNNYQAELQGAATLAAAPGLLSMFAVHHPVLGFSAGTPPTGGNPGLLSVMNATYPQAYYPPNVAFAFHGHVHDFQGISFASGHPATFVAGHGGDNLDVALPDPFPAIVPAAGTVIGQMTYSQSFGFMVMDRVGPQNWKFTAYRRDGSVLTTCTMLPTPCSGVCTDSTPGRQMTCSGTGNLL